MLKPKKTPKSLNTGLKRRCKNCSFDGLSWNWFYTQLLIMKKRIEQKCLYLFEYKELTRKTKVSQKEVDDLVKTIKKGRWERTKQQLDK